jgi:hypothetical protein
MVASLDGSIVMRETRTAGGDPVALGRQVARYLLDDAGGAAVLS